MNYRRTLDDIWVQIGVASFRYAAYSVPDPYCSSDAPYVFTRVSSHLRWIYTTTGLPDPDNPLPSTQTTTSTPTTTTSEPTSPETDSSTLPTDTEFPTTEPNLAANLGLKGIIIQLAITTALTLVVSMSIVM